MPDIMLSIIPGILIPGNAEFAPPDGIEPLEQVV
jgi:hypothetical protein